MSEVLLLFRNNIQSVPKYYPPTIEGECLACFKTKNVLSLQMLVF